MTEPAAIDGPRFRQVLGHYATGVTVVTAQRADGTPVGMSVGSFTSVSLDPPLVAFYPEKTSTTFPQIRETGVFCVNVLASHQEAGARSFAMRGRDRFAGIGWSRAPSGSPIIDDVVAWIDCDIESISELGDHYFVVGRVRALDVSSRSLPLTFFRGGYGKFSSHSLVVANEPDLVRVVRFCELARRPLEDLAADLGTECTVSAPVDGNLVVLASAGASESAEGPALVGRRIPMLPPLGGQFMAWESPEVIAEWLARAPLPLDAATRQAYPEVLAEIRERGWLCYRSDASFTEVDLFARWTAGELVEDARTRFESAVAGLAPGFDLLDVGSATDVPVSRIIVPVLDADGRAPIAINAHMDGSALPVSELVRIRDRVQQAADAAGEAICAAEAARSAAPPTTT